jgi:hypothetical protein
MNCKYCNGKMHKLGGRAKNRYWLCEDCCEEYTRPPWWHRGQDIRNPQEETALLTIYFEGGVFAAYARDLKFTEAGLTYPRVNEVKVLHIGFDAIKTILRTGTQEAIWINSKPRCDEKNCDNCKHRTRKESLKRWNAQDDLQKLVQRLNENFENPCCYCWRQGSIDEDEKDYWEPKEPRPGVEA